MKKFILAAVLYFTALNSFSQKINGQWHGYFNSQGDIVLYGSRDTEYVLELEINGTKVSGFSYSYFQGRRYYVICKLVGTYYPDSKKIKVIEVERIKGNTPPDFSDCFQVHYLTYQKEGKNEELSGTWITKPGQPGSGCGDGHTTLTRRTLDKTLSQFNKKSAGSQAITKKAIPKTNNTVTKPKADVATTDLAKTHAVKKVKPATTVTKPAAKPPVAKTTDKPLKKPETPQTVKVNPVTIDPDKTTPPVTKKAEIPAIKSDITFEKRRSDILKTIEIDNETFKVDLYDNGEVDGDSISLFYNGRLLLSHKKLSEKPITLTLEATDTDAVNELTMYAENLGEIPPNTALMVVTDGDKRYEVRISSDLKNSGTIRFIHKPKNPQ